MKINALLFCLFFGLLGLLVACGTLDKAGVYKGDQALYASDATIKHTMDALNEFEKWELANHATLKVTNPEIARFANEVIDKAPQYAASIKALRATYLANPTPENAASLQNIANLLSALLAQATQYLAQGTTAK